MKRLFISDKIRSLWSLFFALVLEAFLCQSQAASPYTLSHQNSTATIDYQTGGGLTSWTIDGNNQIAQQWFYFRTGGSPGAVSPINSINASPAFSTSFGTRGMAVTYANTTLSVKDSYLLTGNTAGSGQSGLSETITLLNLSAAPLTLDFFQLSHFTLADSSGSETVRIHNGSGGKPLSAWQTNSSGAYLNEILAGEASYAQASTDNLTMNSMVQPTFTHLNGNSSASGDVTFAFEWDFIIPVSGSAQISIPVAIAPEPSALALVALGLVAVALRRQRQRQS